jgi:hypothetical protein
MPDHPISALPEWRVMRVTNVSTHEAYEVGRVRAVDADHARTLACDLDLIRNFQTFRVERVGTNECGHGVSLDEPTCDGCDAGNEEADCMRLEMP